MQNTLHKQQISTGLSMCIPGQSLSGCSSGALCTHISEPYPHMVEMGLSLVLANTWPTPRPLLCNLQACCAHAALQGEQRGQPAAADSNSNAGIRPRL